MFFKYFLNIFLNQYLSNLNCVLLSQQTNLNSIRRRKIFSYLDYREFVKRKDAEVNMLRKARKRR